METLAVNQDAMTRYIGTKALGATPVKRGPYCEMRGWTVPADENPDDDGYLVQYEGDGYLSWSPAAVFEASYRASGQFSFGHALELLRRGERVARAGWNGSGMYAYLVPANRYAPTTEAGHAIARHHDDGLVPYRAYLALKTVDEDIATWAPSCSDVLADDWSVVAG